MYMAQVSSFATFLSGKDRSLQEILDHLTRVILLPLEVNTVVLRQLNSSNKIIMVGRSGIGIADLEKISLDVDMQDRWPSSDAIRNGKIIWINTLPDWGEDYPQLQQLFDASFLSGMSYIAFPIYLARTPIASMIIISRVLLQPNAVIERFLETIGNIFSMYYYRNNFSL